MLLSPSLSLEQLLVEYERGIELLEWLPPPRQRDFHAGGTNTVFTGQGANGSVFTSLSRCEFVSIVHSLYVSFLDFKLDILGVFEWATGHTSRIICKAPAI
jgi:hypothetical protein